MPKAVNYPSLNARKSLNQESRDSFRSQCEEDESQSHNCIVLQDSGSIPSSRYRGSGSKFKNYGSLKRLHPPELSESREISGVDRSDDVSLSPISSSGSAPSASPDVLIELIGKNRLLKLRTNMINQQTIFTAQVFELHRLIKVQKFLAASPGLFLERCLHKGKPVPVKESSSSVHPNNQTSHRLRSKIEFSDKNMIKKLPLPPVSQKPVTRTSDLMPVNRKPTPWSPLDPANNWLVPVMSSSGGLVCGHKAQNVFGVASGYPEYFAHYQLQVPDPSKSSSPAEQMDAFSHTQSSLSISSDAKKPQASRGSDGQTSTAKHHLLSLFPTEPTFQHTETDENERRSKNTIKVIPHPPRLASQSAAKIYRFIQEERML